MTISNVAIPLSIDQSILEKFINSTALRFILNLYGPNGFGKSALLKFVGEKYQSNIRPVSLLQSKLFWTKINCFDLEAFINTLISQLDFRKDLTVPEDILGLSSTLIELVAYLNSQGKEPLILIDDFDTLTEDSVLIFIDQILLQLIAKDLKIKFILTSGKEMEFRQRPHLYTYYQSQPLAALNEADIKEILPGREDLAPKILQWSYGLPPIVKYFVDEVDERNILTLSEYKNYEGEILGPNYRQTIKSSIFPDLSHTTDEVVDTLALMRRFDFAILSDVLPKIYPERFLTFKPRDYILFVRELGDRVYWRDEGAYAINSVIRGMISSYIKVFNRKTFELINQLIMKTYRGWLDSDFRPHYITELAFHSHILNALHGVTDTDNNSISSIIVEQLRARTWDSIYELDQLDQLSHLLKTDRDLGRFINSDVFGYIEKILLLR